MTASHAITTLTLEHFRNYASLQLTLSPAPVVLRGKNGAGKTNILEAISLLAPGRGLRGARLREIDRVAVTSHQSLVASETENCKLRESADAGAPLPAGEATRLNERSEFSRSGEGTYPFVAHRPHPDLQPHHLSPNFMPNPSDVPREVVGANPTSPAERGAQAAPLSPASAPWVVTAQVVTRNETHFIGTGRDAESTADKRIININGERVKGHVALAAATSIQWLTPAMDQIFLEGGGARRKFFDRLAYSFTPEHASHLTAYESAMRERNRLLADGLNRADPYWLSVLEQQMAEHAVAITLARLSLVDRLAHEFTEDLAGFPRAFITLKGEVEHWLREEGLPALEVEQKLSERLVKSRPLDAAKGRASHGCHRSEWEVVHSHKRAEAGYCSTGEQKALLLAILLAAARARANWCGMAPILLLDEVIAHLDADKRAGLFDLIRQSQIQAWMTGTDAADFAGITPHATVFHVAEGEAHAHRPHRSGEG